MALCVYEMEPIGVGGCREANGNVLYFCSEVCRIAFAGSLVGPVDNYEYGEEEPTMGGVVCDKCGKPLS